MSYDSSGHYLHSLTRDGKSYPAVVKCYNGTSIKRMELWMYHGELHSYNDEPAVIVYHEDGSVSYKIWLDCNKFYSRGTESNYVAYYYGYTFYRWFENNTIFTYEKFSKFLDRTSAISKTINGLIGQNKGFHRDLSDGPAYIHISKDGKEEKRAYYVHGEFVEVYNSSQSLVIKS